MSQKTIVILGTGGTISSKGVGRSTLNYSNGKLTIEEQTQSADGIEQLADIRTEQVLNLPSSAITADGLLSLARRVQQLADSPDVDGIVITHGTDTMEETAWFLHLTIHTRKPVVLTGSMRPSTALGADGPMNIYQAVVTARSDKSAGKGVLLVFADCIYSARDVQKSNCFRIEPFSGHDFGALGYVRGDEVFFFQTPVCRHTETSEFSITEIEALPRVPVLYLTLAEDAELFCNASEWADGIVIAAPGMGSIPPLWKEQIQKVTSRGIPVVRTTRTGAGMVLFSEKADGTMDTIPGGTHTPQKARILLMLGLLKTRCPAQLRRIFLEY